MVYIHVVVKPTPRVWWVLHPKISKAVLANTYENICQGLSIISMVMGRVPPDSEDVLCEELEGIGCAVVSLNRAAWQDTGYYHAELVLLLPALSQGEDTGAGVVVGPANNKLRKINRIW